jgi:hypothetical protein
MRGKWQSFDDEEEPDMTHEETKTRLYAMTEKCMTAKTIKMNVSKWSQENKHALRDLYALFLEETKVSFDDFVAGRCVSYSDFQDYMYSQTKYAVR